MNHRWTPPEDEMLAGLAGDLPWPKVVDAYNRWARRHGLPQRTAQGMTRRCIRLRLRRSAVGEFITSGLVSEMLGIKRQTFLRWVKDGWLPTIQYGKGNPYYIRRRDLRKLARQRPHLFGGQREGTLIQLLDNELLARQIVAMELPAPLQLRPVVCIEQGKRYASVGRAARAHFIDRAAVRRVVDRPHLTAAGYHWRTA